VVSAQSPPVREHRRHRYEKWIGAVPVHAPGVAVSTLPTIGEPEIAGRAVSCGAWAAWAATTPVGEEAAEAEPSLFVATTAARRA
jgi:hypothetical protein